VHNRRVMQASALHPAGNLLAGTSPAADPQTGAETPALPTRRTSAVKTKVREIGCPIGKSHFRNRTVANRLSQIRETKNRATKPLREGHCTPEPVRMKCVGKTCCAAA